MPAGKKVCSGYSTKGFVGFRSYSLFRWPYKNLAVSEAVEAPEAVEVGEVSLGWVDLFENVTYSVYIPRIPHIHEER